MPVEWKISEGITPYEDALFYMEQRVSQIIAGNEPEMIWLLQHPPLYTAGSSAKQSDLLEPNRLPVYDAGRGGEFTYHGPGQRVGYVMLNLKQRQAEDIRAYVQNLEQWIINTLKHFDINGERKAGRIGIWVDTAKGEAKIAALGIRVKKWVTYHGIAINLTPDLSHFKGIVPCGIANYGVTSFADIGLDVSMQELDKALETEFRKIF